MVEEKPARETMAVEPADWLARHGDALYRYAYYRVFDAGAAEDLVQETLLAAWRGRAGYRGEAAERTWLTGILKRKLIDYLRKRNHEQPLAEIAENDDAVDRLFGNDPGEHWCASPGAWGNPDATLEQQQFWRAFYACLEDLPPRQARLFALSELEGLAGEELCKVSGASASNVWVMLHRARLRLRECLEQNWFEQHEAKR